MSSGRYAPFLNKCHNFGIFLKKGKRGIIQLDFPNQMILMIQRGHIKKTQQFHSLLYFESEEDLHISIRFLDGDLDFEADTAEEKHTICRLLDLILEAENAEPVSMTMLASAAENGGTCPAAPRRPLVPYSVLKDGVLEKKGNTTITTWNRRRVKISAGEFAYFKPGEELALNVVHLRQDRCSLQRVGQNSLHLTVNQRLYCFRVHSDTKGCLNVESVRDDWIEAFEQAMTMKRAVSVFSPEFLLPPEEDDSGHQGDTENVSDVSSTDGSPFVARKMKSQPDSVAQQNQVDPGKPEITASVSVHFSYNNSSNSLSIPTIHHPTTATTTTNNNTTTTTATAANANTTFVNHIPPRPAKRLATVYPFRRNKDKGSERHSGSGGSDVVSRPHPDSLSDDLPVTALRAKFISHGGSDTDPTLLKTSDFGHLRSTSLKEARSKKLNDRVLAFSDLKLTEREDDPKILTKRTLSDDSATPQALPRKAAPRQQLQPKHTPQGIAQKVAPEARPRKDSHDKDMPQLLSKRDIVDETPQPLANQKSDSELDDALEEFLGGKKCGGKERPSVMDLWKDVGKERAVLQPGGEKAVEAGMDTSSVMDLWKERDRDTKGLDVAGNRTRSQSLACTSPSYTTAGSSTFNPAQNDKETIGPDIMGNRIRSQSVAAGSTHQGYTACNSSSSNSSTFHPGGVNDLASPRDDGEDSTGRQVRERSENSSTGAKDSEVAVEVQATKKKPLWKASSMSDILGVGKSGGEGKKDSKASKAVYVPPPPPPPPLPPPSAVPPPPPLPVGGSVMSKWGKAGKGGSLKLKQVHWTPVEKKLISVSLWGTGAAKSVPTFDLKLLEVMFSISEREGAVIKRGKAAPSTLTDCKRAQNLGILFSGFREDSAAQLSQALLSITEPEDFQLQKMATLKRFQPTAEDTELFKMYRTSRDSLAPVDRFMLDLCSIPKLSVRIDLVLTLWDFPNNYAALAEEVNELLGACDLLLTNQSLPTVLRCLLNIGNHLNAKRQSKNVAGFQVSSIDKMVDLKGRDPAYSLVTYLVEQLQRTCPELLTWTAQLGGVSKVAGYSVRAIGAEIDVLKNDLQKAKKYQKSLKGVSGVPKTFISEVQSFIAEKDKQMQSLQTNSDCLKLRFQQLLAWLGEPPSRTSDVLFSSLALLIERFNTAHARLQQTN